MEKEVEKMAVGVFTRFARWAIFRNDGSLTWFGWICLFCAGLLAAGVLSMFNGCVNLYTRFPTTDSRIESCYQSSRSAAGLSVVVAFPQIMSDNPGTPKYMIENIFTVPIGFVVLCDAACEAVIDTVLLPIDWPLSECRKEGRDTESGRHDSQSQDNPYTLVWRDELVGETERFYEQLFERQGKPECKTNQE